MINITLDLKDNTKIQPFKIVSRTFCRFIPFDPFSFFRKAPLGWHDRLSQTCVTTMKQKLLYETEKGYYEVSTTEKIINYFFKNVLNKGYQRLLITGSFIIPLTVGYIWYKQGGYLFEGNQNSNDVYDVNNFYAGLSVGFIGYWIIYFVSVWIYKGFKESK